MKVIKKLTAFLTSLLILFSMAIIPTGAITVTHDGKEYTLYSHTPTMGDINVLMVRVGFADYPADGEDYPADSEDTLLSYFDGSEDSVNGFYETSSYGKLRLHCDKIYTYNAQYDRDSYDDAEFSLDDLLSEALTALSDEIDFNDYDSNNYGELDIVAFNFAGPTGRWGETWWPHVSYNGDVTVGGKNIETYTLIRGIVNTYIHEFGHIFGATDYYSYLKGNADNIMTFDMMSCNDGDHNGFTKWIYGWFDDEDIAFVDKASGDATVTLAPIETALGDGKKIAVVAPTFDDDTPFLDEYFLVEYDSGEGNNKTVFEENDLAPGFRIFHVNAKAEYDDENASADFILSNEQLRYNLIHNVKNELGEPGYWGIDEMFFREGDSLTPEDYPNTGLSTETMYNGLFTGISFTDFVTGEEPSFRVSFTDEEVKQAEPKLSLEYESLNSDVSMMLISDRPLVQSNSRMEGYEKPYLLDQDGTKLELNIQSIDNSVTRFSVSYREAYPSVQPQTTYTLVIPEGYFMTGYEQRVPEFRQEFTTDSFMALTSIGRCLETQGMRYSNIFAVTDNTYGIIELDASTAECNFVEYNLAGEEIARTAFDPPEFEERGQRLFGCGAYRLNDGSFALCIYTLENNYFTKIDRSGSILSKTYTVSDSMIANYDDRVENIQFDTYKNGLCKLLTGSYGISHVMLTIDFENEPQFSEINDSDAAYYPLNGDFYIRKSFRDGQYHLLVCDRNDAQIAEVAYDAKERMILSAFMRDEEIAVLSRADTYDENGNRTATYQLDCYDQNGNQTDSKDITANAQFLNDYYKVDCVTATGSGYFIVTKDSDGNKIVIACDREWNKLGEFSFDKNTDLAFLGECGLSTKEQYFESESGTEIYLIVSRFNIGEFEIVPKPEEPTEEPSAEPSTDGEEETEPSTEAATEPTTETSATATEASGSTDTAATTPTTAAATSATTTASSTTGSSSTASGGAVQTGESGFALVVMLTLIIAAGAAFYFRKYRGE